MESLKKYLSLTTEYSNITIYTAVELLGTSRQKVISKPQKPSDIYSFGMILYEMVSNNFNYRNESIT
jgi:serine/threonine protein kinase